MLHLELETTGLNLVAAKNKGNKSAVQGKVPFNERTYFSGRSSMLLMKPLSNAMPINKEVTLYTCNAAYIANSDL